MTEVSAKSPSAREESVHKAHGKDEYYASFLLARHLHFPDSFHWHEEDDDIACSIEYPTRLQKCPSIDTFSWNRFIPNALSWSAFPDLHYCCGKIETA